MIDDLLAIEMPERAVRALFDVMERMPEADLGSPGPLVHALEKMTGHYEAEMAESVKRRPTFLSVWMVNRILNADGPPASKEFFMDLLRIAAAHPAASEKVKHEARDFLEYQQHR